MQGGEHSPLRDLCDAHWPSLTHALPLNATRHTSMMATTTIPNLFRRIFISALHLHLPKRFHRSFEDDVDDVDDACC